MFSVWEKLVTICPYFYHYFEFQARHINELVCRYSNNRYLKIIVESGNYVTYLLAIYESIAKLTLFFMPTLIIPDEK